MRAPSFATTSLTALGLFAAPVGATPATGSAAVASPKPASFSFAYADDELLGDGAGRESSWLHVAGTPADGASVPVVVFLHGLNFMGQKHPWFGGGRIDLRPTFDRIATRTGPFVVLAPTQLKDSGAAKSLWATFSVERFVDAARVPARAAGVALATDQVILVGHSGAGCNPDAGLFAPANGPLPRAVFAIDTCLDDETGAAAARLARPIAFVWQELEWPRDPAGTALAFFQAAGTTPAPFSIEKIAVMGTDAHNSVVPLAIDAVLPRLLAR